MTAGLTPAQRLQASRHAISAHLQGQGSRRSARSAHPDGTVPIELTEPISAHYVAMRGTNQAQKRCIALSGEIGQTVGCTIYEQRSETCRSFEAGDERCNQARRHWGLAAL